MPTVVRKEGVGERAFRHLVGGLGQRGWWHYYDMNHGVDDGRDYDCCVLSPFSPQPFKSALSSAVCSTYLWPLLWTYRSEAIAECRMCIYGSPAFFGHRLCDHSYYYLAEGE